MSIRQDIKIQIGLPWSLALTVKQANGTPLDLTNYTVGMTTKATSGGPQLITPTITKPSPTLGKINVYVPLNQTAALNETEAFYDLYLSSEESDHTSIAQGTASFRKWVEAAHNDIVVVQGNSWMNRLTLRGSDGVAKDFNGYTILANIYRSKTDKTVIVPLTTAISSFVVVVSLTGAQTAIIDSESYVYEVVAYNAVESIKLVNGVFTIEEGII